MRVVQVGDVAGVAGMLAELLPMTSVPFRQSGATSRVKVFHAPLRLLEAVRVAQQVRSLEPDIVHVHWATNAIVGPLLGRPWVLHVHGTDVRGRWSPMLRWADAVIAATPDLPGTYLSAPIPFRERGEDRYDVAIASRPDPVKGTAIAEQAVNADWRAPLPRDEFLRRLAETRVIVGQLVIGALGLVELEAMSMGRPVICYIRPELYPDPPPVPIARTGEEVRAHATRLLSDPSEADRIGREGQAWVRKHHDPEKVRERLLEVYRSALIPKSKSSSSV